MKHSVSFTLASSLLLLHATSTSALNWGNKDYAGAPYNRDCLAVASTANGDLIYRDQSLALCLLQRNSANNLLLYEYPNHVYVRDVTPGTAADKLRIYAVDGNYFAPNSKLDDDGQTEVRVRDILLLIAEMCDSQGNKFTPLIKNIRNCPGNSARDFNGCLCVHGVKPRDVSNFQSCVLGRTLLRGGEPFGSFIKPNAPDPTQYKCIGAARWVPDIQRKKKPPPSNSNKKQGDANSHEDDDDAPCYLIYQNGEVVGSTGPKADCDFSDEYDLPWYGEENDDDYPIVSSITHTGLPATQTTTVATATDAAITSSIPNDLLVPSATDAAQSASQAAMYEGSRTGTPSLVVPTTNALSAAPTGSNAAAASTSTKNNSAPGSRQGSGSWGAVVAVVFCLASSWYMY